MMSERQLLPYAPSEAGITRRAFRLLLLLTLINTILLGTFVLGPGIGPYLRQQWDAYQLKRAEAAELIRARAARQPVIAAQQKCLAYTAPATELRYAEDHAGIASLAATGPVRSFGFESNSVRVFPAPDGKVMASFISAYRFPVGATDPPCTAGLLSSKDWAIIFLHERHAADNGPARLVFVAVNSNAAVSERAGDNVTNLGVFTRLSLKASVVIPAQVDADLQVAQTDELILHENPVRMTLITTWNPGNGSDAVAADPHGQLRLFAGQSDANDPAVFQIPYALDGVRGTIMGRLTPDDHVTMDVTGPLKIASLVGDDINVPDPGYRRAKQRYEPAN